MKVGLKFILLVQLIMLTSMFMSIHGQFVCDSGDLATTCYVNSTRVITQLVVIEGMSLVITTTGEILCSNNTQCQLQINLSGTLSVLGYISGGFTNITASFVSIATTGVLDANSFQLYVSTNTMNVDGSIAAQEVNIESSNFTLGSAGIISAAQLGYAANSGPGAGSNGGGGSYGGYSTTTCGVTSNNSGQVYGSIINPRDLGSGGGNCQLFVGGTGGGRVNIIALADLNIYGSILANGGDARGCAGAGSGGTVTLSAVLIAGNGTITANGGANYANGGPGSGGRVAINGAIQPTISILAIGGLDYTCSQRGGAGTIYIAQNNLLLINNGDSSTNAPTGQVINGVTPVPSDYFGNIEAINNANIIVSQCQINSSSITLLVGSSLINGNCLQDGEIIASSIIVDSSSQFVLQNWWTIQANEMTLSGMVYASVIHFSVNTLNIHGGINVDGQGSGPGAGPGAGISDATGGPGGGAGHGANGAKSCGTALGGDEYDIPTNPGVPGSGGGNSGSLRGGAGGGLINIVGVNISISGHISANGLSGSASGSSHSGAGGGSGGAISITASSTFSITSLAVISANGGDGGMAALAGGGGSGGSIFINALNTNAPTSVNVTATGGKTTCLILIPNGTLVSKCAPGYSSKKILQCAACLPGSYSNDGLSCSYCPPGSATDKEGSSECSLCSPGYYSNVSGKRYCLDCAPNTYSNTTGQTQCLSCAYGTVATEGSSNCTACGPGTRVGTGACLDCSAGTFSNQTANQVCQYCYPGYHTNIKGQSACVACPLGDYCNEYGCFYCYYCPAGTYNNVTGAPYCPQCPIGSFQQNTGRTYCSPCPSAYNPGQTYCPYSTSSTGNSSGYTYTSGNTGYSSFSSYSSYSSVSMTYYPATIGGSSGSDSDDGLNGIEIFLIVLVCFVAVSIGCYVRMARCRRGYESITTTAPVQVYQAPPRMPPPQRFPSPQPARQPASPAPTSPNIPPIPPHLSPAQYSVQEGDEARSQECIVCCDAKKGTVLLPCGHVATCEPCTRALLASSNKCPICRNTIVSFVRMYTV